MGRRLFRGSLKLGIIAAAIAAAIGAAVVIGKKLMGGLGPEPGSELAPKEWPSLVPEPALVDATVAGNGSNGAVAADAGATTD